jgi:hypothetical protein
MPRPKTGLTREAYIKKWQSENREKLRENMRRWRAKKKAEKESAAVGYSDPKTEHGDSAAESE